MIQGDDIISKFGDERHERLQRLLQYRHEYNIDYFHYAATGAYVVTCGRTVVACDAEQDFPSEQTMASLHLMIVSEHATRKFSRGGIGQQAWSGGGASAGRLPPLGSLYTDPHGNVKVVTGGEPSGPPKRYINSSDWTGQ